ncbi:MAG: glycoside hydrolase family 127 protein [Kiritimatiellaeota bacterium]|nr:glycoside hydrolase family 127 protein [Kiritimatiellota bacterium]
MKTRCPHFITACGTASRAWILCVAGALAGVGASRAGDPLATRLQASDPATWKPVPYQAEAPTGGVSVADGGLFKTVMENNIAYLLNTFSVDHMLVPFRERAGIKDPPSDGKGQVDFWETSLRGSCAGRFLMGAGGTVRWIEHPELRQRMNQLIDGIEDCRRPDGYVLAFPPDAVRSEEPNYARAWFTHGLIEAGIAGNPKAFKLLRGHADWFNQWDLLPKLTTICPNAQQGYIASTRTYLSPVGKPEDLQVAEKFWVQDWWVKRLAARDLAAVWQYPKPSPHSYLITSFEAYLDQYRATGDRQFLDATLGAWEMIHDHWEHVGGSMAICEGEMYPPDSLFIGRHTSETCGSVFWIKFNQRVHQLFPAEEKYVAEMEKSIYNVCLPAQEGKSGAIRYHGRMEGQSDDPGAGNTCCEGQGTRLFGSLPEYIFSIAKDGLYVNLFEPSSIRWKQAGETVSLTMNSRFPYEPKVELKLGAATPVAMKLRVRVPSWAAADMPIAVNGKQAAIGKPGTYVVLDRTWSAGDTVTFTLPMEFRAIRYTGVDQIQRHTRYALKYGPILLAAAGPLDDSLRIRIIQSPASPGDWMIAKPGEPLHFTVRDHPGCEFMPCWDLGRRTYTCYPVIDPIAIEGTTPFAESTAVKLRSTVAAAVIRYSTDGTEPTAQSPAFSGTLKIDKTCTVRAELFEGGKPASTIVERRFKRTAPVAIIPVPPGLKPGDRYRLVFVTSTKTWALPGADPAAPKSLDDYNAFATKTATAVPALSALGTTWQAVVSVRPASSPAVSAKSNTKTDPAADGAGAPIYNLAGAIVANNNADLWDGTIQNPIDMTELGTCPPGQGGDRYFVWTGTSSTGDASNDWSLLVPGGWKFFGNAWLTDTSAGAPLCGWISSLPPQVGWPWNEATDKTPLPIYVMSGILSAK